MSHLETEKEAYDVDTKQVSTPSKGRTEELAEYELDPHEEKSVIRKVDRRIVPIAMILYLIAFLDRSNIGNAAVGGMVEDLNFPANGLSLATSLFYVTYVTFETPATLLLRTLRPSRLIPAIVVIWGGVCIGNGFAANYPTVLACRLILGLLEAALSPCLVLYMTMFYRRHELAMRLCFLYISSALSGVIGGLIAAGLLKMEGLGGLRGWRWLYIIEGIITCAIGFGVFFFMADHHRHAKYLTERDKFIMDVRQAQEASYNQDNGFSWVEVRKALTDPVIWISGLVQLGVDVCLYGYATFLVVIINQFGFDRIASQGITAPVYAWCAAVYVVAAIVSTKYDTRYKVMMPLAVVTTIGYIMLLCPFKSTPPKLVACILTGTAIYLNVGLHVTWLGQNVAGYRKRSTSVGFQQTIGNIGGVIAGQIYRSQDKPGYKLGHGVSLGFWLLSMVGMTIEYIIWTRRNKSRDKMTAEDQLLMDEKGVTGDRHYSFRYDL